MLDEALVYAESWVDSDPIAQMRKKAARCAEVLVPDRIDPQLILGLSVSCAAAEAACRELVSGLSIAIDKHLFFM
jgi:hypothetical protein